MISTNLNAISTYERMRRVSRPLVADVEDPEQAQMPDLVTEHREASILPGRTRERARGDGLRHRYKRRRELLAVERRRWPRPGSRRERLGRTIDIYA